MNSQQHPTSSFQKNNLPVISAPLYRGAVTGEESSSEPMPVWAELLSTESLFCKAVVRCGYLTEAQMTHAAVRYHLGRTQDDGVIFWQIDELYQVRDGKVMYYREDCHRDKDPRRHPTWYSALLKRQYGYEGDMTVSRCLFGQHLLFGEKTVAIVEAEKTAVILSERFPQYVWMAAGGLSALSREKLLSLRRCRVVLFPDTDPEGKTFRKWREIAQEASEDFVFPIYVSNFLELRASKAQKAQKIDLVDFIFQP